MKLKRIFEIDVAGYAEGAVMILADNMEEAKSLLPSAAIVRGIKEMPGQVMSVGHSRIMGLTQTHVSLDAR